MAEVTAATQGRDGPRVRVLANLPARGPYLWLEGMKEAPMYRYTEENYRRVAAQRMAEAADLMVDAGRIHNTPTAKKDWVRAYSSKDEAAGLMISLGRIHNTPTARADWIAGK